VAAVRERLAAEQAALVRALVDGGPVPAGFDPDRVRATAAALARKRAHEVARAWPARWPTASPSPAPWPARGACPATPRVEAMLAAARLSIRPARLAATVAGPPRRLVVTVRLPALGEHWLSVPLG
jgi:hypothetical protein